MVSRRDPVAMTRYHDLDALRSFAMLLGIALHVSVFLLPVDFWPVQDEWARTVPLAENPYAYLISVIHGFRMPVFFLLSGFFTAMLLRSRGVHRLVRHRLKRIGLPLAVCALTIVPVTEWLFEAGEFHLSRWPLAWLDGLHHLWFLWYLLLLAGAFIVVVRFRVTFRNALWWLLIPLTLWPQHLMVEPAIGADNPAEGLLPTPHVLGYYAVFFFFGVFFFERGIAVRSWWTAAVPVALLAVLPAALAMVYPELFLAGNPRWAPFAASILETSYAWLMCLGLMGLFRWVASRERFWIRYLSDASYWLYVAHLPLVVLCQELLVDQPINAHVKYLLICAVVVGLLLATYQFGVRYTAVGTMLNGPRFRRPAAGAPG